MPTWMEAVKIWNSSHNKGTWCMPRKGSPEHAVVKGLMAGKKAPHKDAAKMKAAVEEARAASKKLLESKERAIANAKAMGEKKSSARKVIGKALLERVMAKRVKKAEAAKPKAATKVFDTDSLKEMIFSFNKGSGMIKKIKEKWSSDVDEGMDDGENPFSLCRGLASDIDNSKKNSYSYLQGHYSQYGGNGSGAGGFIDGIEEAYESINPSFSLKSDKQQVAEPDWENNTITMRVLKKVNLQDLADLIETRGGESVPEPDYWGVQKITVSWKSPKEKREAISFFEALGDE